MTAQELIDNVIGNIGDRSSGRIGGKSTSSAILDGINLGLPHLVQEAHPDYYNRTATVSIVSGTAIYDLPVVDDDGETIRVKSIYNVKGHRSDGSSCSFTQLNYSEFVDRTKGLTQDQEGTPRFFAIWGKDNKIHLDYVPTESYSMVLYVETYPTVVASTELTVPLPMDSQWNYVLECFTTAYCYLKLQQLQMYAMWNDLYLKQKASMSRDENDKHSANISVGSRISPSGDPLNDPMVRRWN